MPAPVFEIGAASKDRTNRFEMDRLIRSNGFSIHSRSRFTLWHRGGHVYHQLEVLQMLDPDKVWEAEYIEMLYWSGFQT
jgi:hypothetical protein